MSQTKARAAYEGRLATWAAARSTPLRVAYENAGFTPTTGETYLRVYLLPADTGSEDVAGAHRVYRGVFQVSIVTPLNGGPGAASGIADELAALFVHNARLTVSGFTVQQTTPLSLAAGAPDGNAYVLPVSFAYRGDTI